MYPISVKLDIFDLYGINLRSGDNILAEDTVSRKYKYGYIGRVDRKKGYFHAVKILKRLSKNYRTVLDLLIWDSKDLEEVPQPSHNFDILTGGRDKAIPIFADIENVILPYEDLSTTIAFPLVLFEAALCGCNVFTTAEIRKFALAEFPNLENIVFDLNHLEKNSH